MIQITQTEAKAVRDKYGDSVNITITNRQKKGSRKKYYVEETPRVLYFLSRLKQRESNRYR